MQINIKHNSALCRDCYATEIWLFIRQKSILFVHFDFQFHAFDFVDNCLALPCLLQCWAGLGWTEIRNKKVTPSNNYYWCCKSFSADHAQISRAMFYTAYAHFMESPSRVVFNLIFKQDTSEKHLSDSVKRAQELFVRDNNFFFRDSARNVIVLLVCIFGLQSTNFGNRAHCTIRSVHDSATSV